MNSVAKVLFVNHINHIRGQDISLESQSQGCAIYGHERHPAASLRCDIKPRSCLLPSVKKHSLAVNEQLQLASH